MAPFLWTRVSPAKWPLPKPPLPSGERMRYFPTVWPRKNICAAEYTLRVRPRFHVPGVTATSTSVELPEDEAEHLVRVLRLGVGAEVEAFDGRGGVLRAGGGEGGQKSPGHPALGTVPGGAEIAG